MPELRTARTLAEALGRDFKGNQAAIDEMLASYTEARETLWAREANGHGSDGSSVSLMSIYWTDAHEILESLLRKMSRKGNGCYWHLAEFYWRREEVMRPAKRKTKTGHICPDEKPRRWKEERFPCSRCWDGKTLRLEYERHSGLILERTHLGLIYLNRVWPTDRAQPVDSFRLAAVA